MTEEKGGLYRAFAWFSSRKLSVKHGKIHFQPNHPTSFDEAMQKAKNVEGWIEKDGEPAHVKGDTQDSQ